MNLLFEIAHFSLPKPNKLKNGDFCKFEFLQKENILIGVLADGVGSNVCDWKASKSSCENFILFFKKNQPILDLPQRVRLTLIEVNQEMLLEDGQCEGMKCTFSLIVWDFNQQKIFLVNVGDSRIYTFQNNTLTQSSKDETQSVILKKKDGKPMVISGTVVTAEGVTNVIGSPELEFEVNSIADQNITGLLLACDGFYNCKPSFQQDLVQTLNSIELQTSLNQIRSSYRDYQSDDMTALLIRKKKTEVSPNQIITSILQNKKIESWGELEIMKAILSELENNIITKKEKTANTLLDYLEKNTLDLGKKSLSDLISSMSKNDFQNRTIYKKILDLMRQSKF